MNDILGAGVVDRGVTSGVTPPNGGGSFIFGMNSLTAAAGGVGLRATPQASTDFDPLLLGGSIRGAIKKGASPGNTGWSPFLFIGAQGQSINDNAYMLGLENEEPFRLVLRKGTMVSGIPSATAANSLRRGTDSFLLASDDWFHLRLDMVVNSNGDVVLKGFQNDLDANPVTAPVWEAIPGITDFVDDALGINSGSQPFVNGRMGFGGQFSDASRRAFFDHIEALKQI